ncbi:hypothetical protein BDV98DRAFT_364798 [Pterulicium gracile]|uniref:C2H2-type domain-containing protein n=1 Tax=Pterulicium gracile TaxID=1884261 RepID=A0A5C3R0I5_9AGAR|nr:hypothetical protein BDV98DRAFT_364798 [Pterula gracilis]
MSPVADLVDTPRRSTRIVMGATSPTLSHKLPTSARKTRKTTATETPRQAFESLHRCSNSRSPRHALSPVLKKLDSVKEEILSSTEVAPTSSSLASPSASKVKVEPSSPIPEPPSSPIFEEGASSPTALKRGHGEADLNYDDAEAEVDEDEDQSDEEDTYVPTRRRQAARRSRRKRGSAPRKKISGPKPVCEECDASFTRMADLTRHVSTVHQKQTDEEIRAERRPDHRRWCLGCSKILARPDARSRHEDSCVRFRQGDPECYDPESAA